MKQGKLFEILKKAYSYHPAQILARQTNTNEKYYPYIASHGDIIDSMFEDIKKRKIQLDGKRFMDVGCGIPIISMIFEISGCSCSEGLDYNPIYSNIFENTVLPGDMTKFNFKNYDILYSYNPIFDKDLMIKGLQNVINTMKSGAIFYFNLACWSLETDPIMSNFTRVQRPSPLWVFVKK